VNRANNLPPESPATADGIKAGGWWHASADGRRVECDLCPRACSLGDGDRGFCFVRQNQGGRMVSTTYGRSTGFCIDPIEKKPLNQFYPGTAVLSFGTAGCNLGCKFCQNWEISKSRQIDSLADVADPATIAGAAKELGCRSVAFTYNDPVIWAEYAIDTAQACHELGVKTVAVTAGYITPVARPAFYEVMDAANVDLKGFTEAFYWKLTSGHLDPVLDTLRWLVHESDVWVEITNLVIPQANDASDEFQRMCDWILDELGPDVPVHFTAFHPDFRLRDRGPTPLDTLRRAYDTAHRAGLHYVYTGNLSDVGHESTYCPGCQTLLIERDRYQLGQYRLRGNRCAECGTMIAGHFDDRPGDWGPRRQPVRIGSYAGKSRVGAATTEDKISAQESRTLKKATTGQPAPNTGQTPAPADMSVQPELTLEQQQRVFQAACREVVATTRGQSCPAFAATLGDAATVPVYGAFVSLRRGGRLRSCCGFMGQSIALAEAVECAAIRAARDDPRFPPIDPAELEHLDVDVWLLWGPRPVEAQGPQREACVMIGRHGLQIARGDRRGLLLPGVAIEHHLNARQFLEQVCLKAGLEREDWKRDDTLLMTFEGFSIPGPMPRGALEGGDRPATVGPSPAEMARLAAACGNHVVVVAPGMGVVTAAPVPSGVNRPDVSADKVRRPAVAGAFYPGTAEEIEHLLGQFLPELPPSEPWPAALVPHAGWVYSGRLAAATLARVKIPPQVIVFCPRHRGGGPAWSVTPHETWLLPGGSLAADPELAARLAAAIPGLALDGGPHRQEHAIEVQLPILARLAPQSRVVGIAVGHGTLAELLRFAEGLAGVLASMSPRPLLVISSDMNHYANDADTRRLDQAALRAMQTLDPTRLFETVTQQRISMCGLYPAVIVMETLRRLDALRRFELVGYATSAEASGDTQRCVGYAGALLG
jgi:AmmeMemoRadiSam system radical SAM enzyme/AmmeMemoRadiSam system protein B/AmmeMemoRadiSam system protein A